MSCKYHCEDGPFVEGTPPVDNYCSSCGRDLRLPVARVYDLLKGITIPTFDGKQWWRIKGSDNHWRMYEVGWDALTKSWNRHVFGPVTVAPKEVPE